MKVIFTCGGTAGHVNPALALAGYMQKQDPHVQVLFVGTPDGMERDLVEKAGYAFRGIPMGGFQRSLGHGGLAHNLHSLSMLTKSHSRARAILRDFRPDLVVGTGGYASFPMVRAASLAHIPTAVHESNSVPGLTTKMLEDFADVIMVGFEDCRQHYRHPERIMVTGTPVRGGFFDLTRSQAREKLGLTDGRPLIVSFWGSLGASHMNAHMEDFFRLEAADGMPFHHIHGVGKSGYPAMTQRLRQEKEDGYPFYHIHAVGGRGWETMQQEMQKAGLPGSHKLDVRKYIYDMAVVMRAADLVICRAGASTISEITALATPAILVPSPYVTNNHQEKNARILEQHGGAVVLLEADASGEALYRAAAGILRDPQRQADMSRGMAELGIRDATQRLYDTVMSILR